MLQVVNYCEASLYFFVRQEYLKEGRSLPAAKLPPPPSPQLSLKSKGKPKKQKKMKSIQQFEMLTPELIDCLDREFVDVAPNLQIEPVFRLLNVDDRIIVPAGEARVINIRFTPPTNYVNPLPTEDVVEATCTKNERTENGKRGDTADSASVQNTERKDLKETRMFAAKYRITFADIKLAKEYVIIGSTKKQKTKNK